MVQVNQVDKPINGYLVEQGNKHFANNEDQIIKKTPLTSAKIMANKISKDLFVYAPKGMKGSVNSNFYEYLSLGIVPYIIGSGVLIALYNGVIGAFNAQDKAAARFKGAQMAAGVVLYGVGKWLGGKLINKGVQARTGIDMDMPYKKVVNELRENPNDKNTSSVEFHKVFESVDFPRWDLINKKGELNGNRHEYYDKIAKKMGYKEKLNSPEQIVQPKVKEVVTKAMAAKSVSAFLWAGLGVAMGAQKPFSQFAELGTLKLKAKYLPKTIGRSFMSLYNGGTKPTLATKALGKAFIFAAVGSTVLGIINACSGFAEGKKHQASAVDLNKEHVEG